MCSHIDKHEKESPCGIFTALKAPTSPVLNTSSKQLLSGMLYVLASWRFLNVKSYKLEQTAYFMYSIASRMLEARKTEFSMKKNQVLNLALLAQKVKYII